MSTEQKTIDDIETTKTALDGSERIPGRDSNGDFKITVANLTSSLAAPSTYYAQADYTILDTDNYERIEVDTTTGDITITLPLKANNLKRAIDIAHVKGTNKVIISPNATDANKLGSDGLGAIWLPKVGNRISFQESANSGFWEITAENITAQLRLNTYAGYGSTDTKIMQFTNSVEDVGNMFSHNHGAYGTAGLEITINKSGKYCLEFNAAINSTDSIGLTLNSSALSTSLSSITDSTKLAQAVVNVVAQPDCVSVTLSFDAGDIIRPHANGGSPGAGFFDRCFFNATYIA